ITNLAVELRVGRFGGFAIQSNHFEGDDRPTTPLVEPQFPIRRGPICPHIFRGYRSRADSQERREAELLEQATTCVLLTLNWLLPHHAMPVDGAGPPAMLNSARRLCTSPRRGRQVEWSDKQPGLVRLHFRARRFCRRCAANASYDSVANAGSIDVTTTDKPLRIDSVKRCKGCPGIIESEEVVWRDKEESMSHA